MKKKTFTTCMTSHSTRVLVQGLLVLLPVLCLVTQSSAQKDAQFVYASQGDYSTSSEMQLSWTIGENFIETIGDGDVLLTQGFQQSFLKIKKIEIPQRTAFEARVYPNPSQGLLTLETFENDTACQLEVYDAAGRLLQKRTTYENKSSIDLTAYEAGQYFIRLSTGDGSKLSLFEIIKL